MRNVAAGNLLLTTLLLAVFSPMYTMHNKVAATASIPAFADTADEGGRTCLHCAASRDDIAMARLLLYYGADAQKKTHVLKKTPLHYCISDEMTDILKSAHRKQTKSYII